METLGVHGGLQVLDRSLYSALAAQADLSVVWVTCDENTATDPGYELWTPFQGIYGSDAMWRRGFRYAQGYRRLLRRAVAEARGGPVVIHQQFITFPALELAFMRAARRRGIGWVSTPHESAMHHDPSRTGRLIGRMCRASDALIALSTANLESLKRIVLRIRPTDQPYRARASEQLSRRRALAGSGARTRASETSARCSDRSFSGRGAAGQGRRVPDQGIPRGSPTDFLCLPRHCGSSSWHRCSGAPRLGT